MRKLLLAVSLLISATSAYAQDSSIGETSSETANVSASLSQLLSKGYEIKAAVPNGKQFIVFVQKDQSAYACEFVSVAKTRCGSLN